MNDNTKKIGLIAVIVVALAGAVFGAMRLFGEEKMVIENTVKMPEGYKSEKQRAIDAQSTGQPAPEPAGKGGADRDLGGDLGG